MREAESVQPLDAPPLAKADGARKSAAVAVERHHEGALETRCEVGVGRMREMVLAALERRTQAQPHKPRLQLALPMGMLQCCTSPPIARTSVGDLT